MIVSKNLKSFEKGWDGSMALKSWVQALVSPANKNTKEKQTNKTKSHTHTHKHGTFDRYTDIWENIKTSESPGRRREEYNTKGLHRAFHFICSVDFVLQAKRQM